MHFGSRTLLNPHFGSRIVLLAFFSRCSDTFFLAFVGDRRSVIFDLYISTPLQSNGCSLQVGSFVVNFHTRSCAAPFSEGRDADLRQLPSGRHQRAGGRMDRRELGTAPLHS